MIAKNLLDSLHNHYGELHLPVVVCRNDAAMPIVYMNIRAGLILSPAYSVEQLKGEDISLGKLSDHLRFDTPEAYHLLVQMCGQLGKVSDFQGQLVTFDGKEIPVSIVGNSIDVDSSSDHIVFYLLGQPGGEDTTLLDSRMSLIINTAMLGEDVDASIQTVLAMAGQRMRASRAYIFEEISATTTRNTYEWCGDGIEPAIHMLQNLKKEEYNYDVITQSGMYVVETVHTLPDGDREILEAQGIRALAILPIYDALRPLGYVGFDDCERERKWSYDEIQFLQNIAPLLAILLKRRNAEQMALRSQKVLQLISDNSRDIIYANTLDDYRLVFVSKSLSEIFDTTPEELVGKPCYEVFGTGEGGPCSYCPIPGIRIEPGEERGEVYTWENTNPHTGKTYLVKDNIIKWVDDQYVHVETAVDISERITYEEQLRFLASTDVMTGIYKREWGSAELERMINNTECAGSLTFVDIDGLKHVNDTLGHAYGDQLLQLSVAAIRRHLPSGAIFCRWGGDEFLIWMQNTPEEAGRIIKAAQADIALQNQTGENPFKLAFSYGIIAFEPGPDASLDAMITDADQLMYENKMSKRGLRRRRDDTRGR